MPNAHRLGPRLVAPLVTTAAYMVAAGSAIALTRFGGGAAFLWAANAVLLAALITSRRRHWPLTLGLCWCGGVISSGYWGVGWLAAPFMSAINISEPLLAALLVRRWGVHRSGLDSGKDLALFTLAIGIVGPVATSFAGALVINLAVGIPYLVTVGHWCVAHSLGAITFTPVFVQIVDGEMRRWIEQAGRRRIVEALVLLALVVATTTAVFAQSALPLLFLPILPLMIVTFRVGRVGAASAVVLIALIGMTLTLLGCGPVNLIHAGLGAKLQFLQLYLAVTVLTVLPVAADLARRARLFDRLRDSEARFRLLTEHSTDVILNLDVDGTIRYVSPSIKLLGGYDPAALVGRSAGELIDEEDRERVGEVHRLALAAPDETFAVEYRGIVPGDDSRWFETRTRAMIDEDGVVQGVVSAVRETSGRRRHEMELSRAADTDPLTGLANRRAFDRELTRIAEEADGLGCVALFDLDHFKAINDRYGHPAGDEVLRSFARRAERQVRTGDLLARIGGEEFAIVFPRISMATAEAACDRIRRAIASDPFMVGAHRAEVTVSVGLSPIREGEQPDTVTDRADAALYRSKSEGRNRLSLAA